MQAARFLLLSGALSLVAIGQSCHSDEAVAPASAPSASPAPTPEPLPACAHQLSVADLPNLWTFGQQQRKVGDMENHVINSDSAYRALYAGPYPNALPPVDFRTHTLLIGKVLVNTSASATSQQVVKACTGRYTYSVQITRGVGQAYMDVLYKAVVAKLPTTAQVDFDVKVMPY